jgi:hypothetical protein
LFLFENHLSFLNYFYAMPTTCCHTQSTSVTFFLIDRYSAAQRLILILNKGNCLPGTFFHGWTYVGLSRTTFIDNDWFCHFF